jgi:glycosyltransferase involved in cell wall biosynthesis
MYKKNKVVVVLPAYNASKTLEITLNEIPMDIVDELILVDDASNDNTSEVAKKLGVHHVIKHEKNKGYGGNQKSCYDKALEIGADIVVMVHPDYQYTPKLIEAMVSIVGNELYDVVLASRILGKGALKGGMPMYKYMSNRMLTLMQNFIINEKLSEYHTGYRAFSSKALRSIDYRLNSDDFVFDNQMIAQLFYKGFECAEVTCPTKYFEEASSINFKRSVIYGLGCLKTACEYRLNKLGILKTPFLNS